ncbi:MAG: helix-turn-helix domain-containing protein [Hyphomicrobiales bacterium]
MKEPIIYNHKLIDKEFFVKRSSNKENFKPCFYSENIHRHEHYQIIWVYKGCGTHTIEQTTYNYTDGSLFILSPHYVHQFKRDRDFSGYLISFADTFLNDPQYRSILFYNSPEHSCLDIPVEEREMLNSEFERLNHYYEKPDFYGKTRILQNYLYIILTRIEGYRRLLRQKNLLDSDQYFHTLEEFALLVHNHFFEEKNLSFYLDKLSVSRRKLNDIIKETTGFSPARFIEQYTMDEAVRMLRYTDYSVKEISGRLGYLDDSYFIKVFKKQFRKTPLAYREEFSNKRR